MTKRKIGLVIGTNNYADRGIKDLDFAEDDAKAIKEVLLDANLCGFDEVIEVIDKPWIEASKKIEKILKDAEHDDLVLFYFSGHGKLDNKGKLCLLFKDTEIDYLFSTSLFFGDINRCIGDSKCKTVLIIIDSCFSGAAGIKGDDLLTRSLSEASGTGRIILSATKEFEVAKEDQDLKQGVFTHYLLEGLKTGAADTDDNGLISVDEFYDYAYKKIKEGYPQTPTKRGEFEGEIFIGKNPKKIKENIFKENIKKLIKKSDDGLPFDLYNQAVIILSKLKEHLSHLTDIEKKIKPFLENFLNDKIDIMTYIHTIEALGGLPPSHKISELRSQAQKLLGEKRYGEAIAKWQEVLKLDPENRNAIKGIEEAKRILKEIEELNTSAQQLYDKEKYREALDTWQKVLNFDSENKTAKDGLEKAEEEVNKKRIIGLSWQAQKLLGEKRYAEVIAKWQEVLKLDPENRKAIEGIKEAKRILKEIEELNTSAQELYNQGKKREALDTWQKVLNFDSENKTAKDGLEKAEEEVNKKRIIGLSWQAQKLSEEKRYAEAIAKWQEVLKLDPENREAIERIEEAKRILKEIEELNTPAQELYNQGKNREALDTWQKVLDLDSENQTAKVGIKKAEEKLQVKKKIRELISQAEKLFKERKYAEAIAKCQEVLKLDPENRKAVERIEEAKRILEEIEELNTPAQELYNQGKNREALDTWQKVLDLDSENQTAKVGIKKAEEKLQVKKKIRELSSQAQKLLGEKRYAEAIAKCQEVSKLDPENRKAVERIEEAKRILKEIEELNTSAQQLYDKEKYREALDTWQKVLNLNSENKTAKDGIKKAEKKIAEAKQKRVKKARKRPMPSTRQFRVHILIDESHKEQTSNYEFSELKEKLSEWGELTVCDVKPLTANDLKGQHVLIIGGPVSPWVFGRGADKWTRDEVVLIKTFVSKGGGLLVLGYSLIKEENLNVLTSNFGIYFLEDDVGNVSVVDLEKHPLTEGLKEIKLGSISGGGGKYLQAIGPADVLARYEGLPVLVASEYGSGRVVAMASVGAFSDKYLQANARFLDNILMYLCRKTKR